MSEVAGYHPQFVVNGQGLRTSAFLPVEEYETLLEDLSDLAAVAERRTEPVAAHADVMAIPSPAPTDGIGPLQIHFADFRSS